jgi:hypothetical protein
MTYIDDHFAKKKCIKIGCKIRKFKIWDLLLVFLLLFVKEELILDQIMMHFDNAFLRKIPLRKMHTIILISWA